MKKLSMGPTLEVTGGWHGSTIDAKNHWRRNTTWPCEHVHRTREAALVCGVRLAAKRSGKS